MKQTVKGPRGFAPFWRQLEAILIRAPSTDTVFNQYRDFNGEVDVPAAAAIRRDNLRAYLKAACESATVLVVGEAAGPWECRFSGIPFTGERQLLDPSFPYKGERSSRCDPRRPTRGPIPPFVSASAKAFWGVMLPCHRQFVLWNALPLHPHQPGEPLSVRNPGRREVAEFGDALGLVISHLSPGLIIAVGRKAEEQLEALGEAPAYVRHPSQGGRDAFAAGMKRLLGPSTAKGGSGR